MLGRASTIVSARAQRCMPLALVHRAAALSTAAEPAAPIDTATATAAASARRSSSSRPSVKDASSESAQRSFALRLYKALLRAHRTVLPDAMRSLGDAYVREEFKLHKTAKPQHLHGFFTQWIQCQWGERDRRTGGQTLAT
jgi:3-oxoacyl-ACP reductase-like protein